VTLAQGTDVFAPESTKTVTRGMDELRPIYDSICKQHGVTDEALSGRGCQTALYYLPVQADVSMLMEYLIEKDVAVSCIIPLIKCATPATYNRAFRLRLAQHEAYVRRQSAGKGKQQETAQKVGRPASPTPLFLAPQIGALV